MPSVDDRRSALPVGKRHATEAMVNSWRSPSDAHGRASRSLTHDGLWSSRHVQRVARLPVPESHHRRQRLDRHRRHLPGDGTASQSNRILLSLCAAPADQPHLPDPAEIRSATNGLCPSATRQRRALRTRRSARLAPTSMERSESRQRWPAEGDNSQDDTP